MTAERISILFNRYMEGNATEAERLELSELVLIAGNTPLIRSLEQEYWEKMKEGKEDVTEMELEKLMNKITVSKPAIVKSLFWRRIAVAASIIIALGIGTYFFFINKEKSSNEIVKTEDPTKDVKAPDTNRAMITLSDGRKVYLDSAGNGQLALQGNVKVIRNADGQIVYEGTANAMEYNALFNPRGSKVQPLTLSDGTRVWLNSESSIRFPTAFSGNERTVAVTGEAYFEVVHDATKPFYVSKGELIVQVLGTRFNVNTYDDESTIKVTLLEGSVKTAIGNGQSVVLKPGQQAQVSSNIKVVNVADLDEVMAWKNGKFIFGAKADIQTIMRQIARWYDVDVEYAGGVPKLLLGGDVPRTSKLSQVLEILKTSGVKFSIEGKKVTISP